MVKIFFVIISFKKREDQLCWNFSIHSSCNYNYYLYAVGVTYRGKQKIAQIVRYQYFIMHPLDTQRSLWHLHLMHTRSLLQTKKTTTKNRWCLVSNGTCIPFSWVKVACVTLHPSWDFMLCKPRYVIYSGHQRLTQTGLHCRYIQAFQGVPCVSGWETRTVTYRYLKTWEWDRNEIPILSVPIIVTEYFLAHCFSFIHKTLLFWPTLTPLINITFWHSIQLLSGRNSSKNPMDTAKHKH